MLNIQGATLGFDVNGVQSALNNIHANVIEEASNALLQGLSTLNSSVDEAWVGRSADTFKQNMEHDANEIRNELQTTYEALQSEFNQIANKMSEADEELVKGRG